MVEIRQFKQNDAKAISDLIGLTMQQSNAMDYQLERLQPLINYFSAGKIEQLNLDRHCLVAELDGRIVGTAALEAGKLCTFFVHPDFQQQGIGTALLDGVESAASGQSLHRLLVEASLSGVRFYERHGYVRTGKVIEGVAGQQIEVEKVMPGAYP